MMIHWKDVDPGIKGLTKRHTHTHSLSSWAHETFTPGSYMRCVPMVTHILHRVAFPSKSICRDASERAREDSIRNAVRSAAKGLGHQPPRLLVAPFRNLSFVVQVSQKIKVPSRYLESRCTYNAVDAQSEAIEWPTHTQTHAHKRTQTHMQTHTQTCSHMSMQTVGFCRYTFYSIAFLDVLGCARCC